MKLVDAFKILNLSDSCTEEEVKKNYKKLVKKYHPDTYVNKSEEEKQFAEETTKKINEAKEMIINYLKNQTKFNDEEQEDTYFQEIFELKKAKQRILEELKKELNYISSINEKDKIFESLKKQFLQTIYEFKNSIDKQLNIQSLNLSYQIYHEKYDTILRAYKFEINKRNYLFKYFETETNHTNSIHEFRVTISQIIDKILEKIVEKELINCQYIEDYEMLQTILSKTKFKYNEMCLYGYINIEIARQKFNEEIKDVISKYYKRKQLYEEIINLNKIYIPSYIIDLYNALTDEEKFYEIYNNIGIPTKIRAKVNAIFFSTKK